MERIQRLYRDNVNAIIATLLIHIVVVLCLLFARLKNSHELTETALFVDMVAEEIKQPVSEKEKPEQDARSSAIYGPQAGEHYSNRAYNMGDQNAKTAGDPFFDKAYAKEVAAAKQLASDVSRNLARKIPDIGDVPMPVASTEGMTREEAQRSTFKGKSNIRYQLGNRYHLQLPIPVYLARGGGEVVVDIVVNREGEVLSASPRDAANLSDPTILAYAKQAAEKTIFNPDNSAPEKERGTITYLFVAQ